MRVAYKPKGLSPTRPPSWREQRTERIAAQQAERPARRRGRSAEPVDEEEEEEAAPRTRSAVGGKVSKGGGKASAVTSRATLKKQRGMIERGAAWLVLLLSFVGSIAVLHGGFAPMIASITAGQYNVGALVGGALIQIVLTFLEWYYFDRWAIAWGARLVDTATTALGFGPLFAAPLTAFLLARGAPTPLLIAWGIISLVSLAIAWFPESRLVE